MCYDKNSDNQCKNNYFDNNNSDNTPFNSIVLNCIIFYLADGRPSPA